MAPDTAEPTPLEAAGLVTAAEAATILGVSVSTLSRYRKADWIQPAVIIGRSMLYRRADVEALRDRLRGG